MACSRRKDGADILISIQNDREWRILAEDVMGDAALAADPKFAKLVDRVKHRAETDGKVAAAFATMDVDDAVARSSKPPTSRSRASTTWRA